MRTLPVEFYLRDTIAAARGLIGCVLNRKTPNGTLSGRIVETEAYISGDPANHAFRGMKNRNKTMFGPPAHAYVYSIHRWHCLNLVTQPEGLAEAVLIRAIVPLEGLDMMMRNRRSDSIYRLTSGPGRLCDAFDIDTKLDGADLTTGELTVLRGRPIGKIVSSTRIGVTGGEELMLRFFEEASPFVSRARTRS